MKIANNIIGNILGKPRKRGGRKDWDGDGVPNKKDCQPRNTMRQDDLPAYTKGETVVYHIFVNRQFMEMVHAKDKDRKMNEYRERYPAKVIEAKIGILD